LESAVDWLRGHDHFEIPNFRAQHMRVLVHTNPPAPSLRVNLNETTQPLQIGKRGSCKVKIRAFICQNGVFYDFEGYHARYVSPLSFSGFLRTKLFLLRCNYTDLMQRAKSQSASSPPTLRLALERQSRRRRGSLRATLAFAITTASPSWTRPPRASSRTA
jgi:hypothetical protein